MSTFAARRALFGDADDGGPGWVTVSDGVVVAVGRGTPPAPPDHAAAVLAPGFVDLHVHGGGGHDASRSPADLAAARAFHRAHGTVASLVSLVSAPVPSLLEQLAFAAGAVDDELLGIHLEGPFLSPSRAGAHDPSSLRNPDRGLAEDLLAAAAGRLRVVTIAPELPGALTLVELFAAAGVVVAVGHTDADHAQASAAFDAGASLVTHLGNAMPPVAARSPGPALAALERGVVCEVVNDGVHVHPAVVRAAARATPVAFVTDAIAAAGCPDGTTGLGGREVVVRDGVARLADDPATLAGSTLTTAAAVARAVADGWPLDLAVAAASTVPAGVLGLDLRVAAGRPARLVLLDDALRVQHVVTPGP